MPGGALVGICEDDDELRGVVRTALEREGYRVLVATTGHEAVARFTPESPDALILDIGLPDADGRDVCQALRARTLTAPVLFLTARDALTDRLSGFHAGGDDYLVKPFALAELVVRVGALVRRARSGLGSPARRGVAATADDALMLDPAGHGIAGPRPVALTPTEFRLLGALAAGRGEVVRRATLVRAAWPDGAIVHENTLDAYVSRVRAKLRGAGREERIANVRGVGYVLR